MTANENPTCEGCGEQHPPATTTDVYNAAISVILAEAQIIAEEHGEHFERLARAVEVAEAAAAEILKARLAQVFAVDTDGTTTAPDAAPGFYL